MSAEMGTPHLCTTKMGILLCLLFVATIIGENCIGLALVVDDCKLGLFICGQGIIFCKVTWPVLPPCNSFGRTKLLPLHGLFPSPPHSGEEAQRTSSGLKQ